MCILGGDTTPSVPNVALFIIYNLIDGEEKSKFWMLIMPNFIAAMKRRI